jgi:hypothetical protein
MKRICWLLIFLCLAGPAWAVDEPLRFLVVGDPQFKVRQPGQLEHGYTWQTDMWPGLPLLMRKLQARYLFVCGDIFEFKVGDGTTIPGLWDEWDRYLATFDDMGSVEWVPGGHEFWGGKTDPAPLAYFFRRYPDRVRSSIVDGDNLFIMFDDVHEQGLDGNGLAWLAKTLRKNASAKHVWFFGHVPPRNTADWWPNDGRPANDVFRIQMAQLLDGNPPSAAFFGHEHMETYLGDPGGWPMFATGPHWPLLVEVADSGVRYRWLMNPLADDPLAGALDALTPTPVLSWQVVVFPGGAPLPTGLPDFNPEGMSTCRTIDGLAGTVDLSGLSNLQDGDRVLAVANYPSSGGWQERHARIRSDLPFTVWVNGMHVDATGPTLNRFRFYMVPRSESNRVAILFEVNGPARTFTFFRHGFARELQLEAR